jgi:hypothetical protein
MQGIRRWDIVTTCSLVIVAFFTPLEVALYNLDLQALQQDDSLMSMFVLNRVIDAIFIVDMIIQVSGFQETE